MAGVVHIPWYATILRHETFGEAVAQVAPLALRYGATKYQVQRNLDDRYKILHMTWFNNHEDFYKYWESPEMIEFRARHMGHYQVPVIYTWHDELASGEVGPSVANGNGHTAPEPELEPSATH